MSVLDELASALNRRDEEPNQQLAKRLIESEDPEDIQELVDNLKNKNKAIRSNCIKVLYEIGEKRPVLIENYVDEFVALLKHKDNRLVWGGMTALGYIASRRPQGI
jgi:HEAT repeat protein